MKTDPHSTEIRKINFNLEKRNNKNTDQVYFYQEQYSGHNTVFSLSENF